MNPDMQASIIIVVYNGLGYLEQCLGSVLQESIPSLEVILVDNNSTDDSAEFVRQNWPKVTMISNDHNRGFAAACNQGAAVAKGEFLVFLNQDTRTCSGWLSALLDPLRQLPSVGLTTAKLLLMSKPGLINMCGQDIHFTGLTFSRGFLKPSSALAEAALVSAVSGACFAIRRELFRKLNGFDEGLFMYYEDTDLSWRAILAGFHCLYVPGSAVYHDYRPGQAGYLSLYYTKRNRQILLLKTWRWSTLLLLTPSLLLAEVADWAHAALVGRHGLVAKLNASAWCLLHLPTILRSRRLAIGSRKTMDFALLDQCVDRMHPTEVTTGKMGQSALAICNVIFHVNAVLAYHVCRSLRI